MLLLSIALCYRNGKAYDRARQAYERAAEAHYKNAGYPFFAPRYTAITNKLT